MLKQARFRPGERYSPLKVTGVLGLGYLSGVQICGLVRLRVLKPEMTD